MKKLLSLSLIILFLHSVGYCQQHFSIFNNHSFAKYDKHLYTSDSLFHTSIKPYYLPDVYNIITDNDIDDYKTKDKSFNKKLKNWFYQKLLNDDFITVVEDDFRMTINPLVNFEFGKDFTSDITTYTNTRGIQIAGKLGKDFTFYSNFYENQAVFVPYINNKSFNTGVVPGQGSIKKFWGTGLDYAMANGYISYSPSNHFNFQFGHDKHFWGDGYRSLLLSDNSFNYPFLKITSNFWNFKYINLFVQFQDMNRPTVYQMGFQKKYGSFHYLSWAVNKNFNISLFESVIWQATDSAGNNRGFDINYLNPIIFFRPVEFSLYSPDNSLIGINLKYKLLKKNIFYGQILIDDINIGSLSEGSGHIQNKIALQIGYKGFDLFGIENLSCQTEYNQVQPYVYAHKTPEQNYTHYNQALAHPLGANFRESVSFIKYNYKRLYFEAKFLYAIIGSDTSGSHWGNDIFKSDHDAQLGLFSYGNKLGQGSKTTLTFKDFRISYLLNPKTNLNLSLGISERKIKNAYSTDKCTFIFVSLRTSLRNLYYDF